MTCDECTDRLSDAVDGTLDAATAAAVDAHLRTCAACRATRQDLETIAASARTLERHEVPPDAWARIAARLERPASSPLRAWLPGGSDARWRGLAAAAAVVLVLAAAGAGWLVARGTAPAAPTADVAATTTTDDAIQTVETELSLAQEHYERAIAGLEQITNGDTTLDPELAAVLQNNLTVIDTAIDESREALNAQPTNEVAQQSLFGALRNKVTLLQETVALINEMRQGDQEGAARIASGLNQ